MTYNIVTKLTLVASALIAGGGHMLGHGWLGLIAVAIFQVGAIYGTWTNHLLHDESLAKDRGRR